MALLPVAAFLGGTGHSWSSIVLGTVWPLSFPKIIHLNKTLYSVKYKSEDSDLSN